MHIALSQGHLTAPLRFVWNCGIKIKRRRIGQRERRGYGAAGRARETELHLVDVPEVG